MTGDASDQAQDGVIAAVIVAAGRGERAGQSAEGPKQYRRIGGRPVIARTLEAFLAEPRITRIVCVIHRDDDALFAEAAAGLDREGRVITVHGGSDRQASVLKGLEALAAFAPVQVLIHDGVRPFADASLVGGVIDALGAEHGVLAAIPVTDTLKRADSGGLVGTTVDRNGLFAAQTPQAFPFEAILSAHRRAAAEAGERFTDDAAIAAWAGIPVIVAPGSSRNVKITWAEDIAMADRMLSAARFPDIRTGNGYDVHAFAPGDGVWLCGVFIPFDRKLDGHSDADAPLHALTDALLATIGAGDIGTHFPPSDPQWKGAASSIFVEHAASLVRARGGRIANADITIIAEAPKVGPHREAMTAKLASMLAIAPERISVKATTNEKMGFVGRREGIAAIATATVAYPGELPA